ncbi:MAG: hypothetical protein QW548_02450 [Candidatus Aenigmatarchaeota archaeon]
MNRKLVLSIALLISVALAAGCVGQIPGLPAFGSDVIKPAVTSSTMGIADVIAIEGVQTLPAGSILPDQSLRLFMNIVSHDTEPLKPIQNIVVQLYDASVFKNKEGTQLCNQATDGCQPEPPVCTQSAPCSLQAGETKPIVFNLKAPTAAEIANITTRATLSWLVRYNYTSTTSYDVLLVSESEILRLQQLGQTLSVPLQNIQSQGPVKVDASMAPAFGVVGATTPDIYITFKLRNVGSGFVKGNNITKGALSVTIPRGLGTAPQDSNQFTCQGQQGGQVCTNKADIDFFKKETIPLQLKITPSAASLPQGTPHRTFTINAQVSYTYELRGSTTVEITPPKLGG